MAWNTRGKRQQRKPYGERSGQSEPGGEGGEGGERGGRKRRRKIPPEEATLLDVEAKAMELLGMRDHAIEELRRKLRDRRYDRALIDQTIDRMIEFRYLDDTRFAERMAASLMRQGWGPYRIKQKLQERGLDRDLVDDTMQAIDDEDEASDEAEGVWVVCARDQFTSKFRCEPGELEREDRDRAFRHLQYRGFSGATIIKVLG